MRDWSSNQKGDVAEAAIRLAAIRHGIAVYAPINDHSRADMLFEIGGSLLRIQCKWAGLTADGACITVHSGGFRLTYSGHTRSTYSAEEIDYLAVYVGETGQCFLLPPSIFAGKHQVRLRLTPVRNNQRACVNLAGDYDFDGAVAQLEERRHGMAEARGSSPLSSTSHPSPESAPARTMGCDELRDTLGYVIEQVASGEEIVITRRGTPRIRLLPA
jgi:prevent-host-death family protein